MGTDRASLHRLSGNTNEFQRQQPLPQMGWREEETEGERGAFAGAACLVSKPPLLINVTAELLHSPCAGVGWVGGRWAADSVRGTGAAQPFLLLHPQEGARKRKQRGYRCCMPRPSTQMAQRHRGEPVTTSNNLQRSEDCEPSTARSHYWDGGSLGMGRRMWRHPLRRESCPLPTQPCSRGCVGRSTRHGAARGSRSAAQHEGQGEPALQMSTCQLRILMRADQQLKCIHAPLVIREARCRRRARAEAPVALQGPGRCGDARDERGPSSCHTTHFTGVCVISFHQSLIGLG